MNLLTEELGNAFEKAGYDRNYGKVVLSNRPDLCEYQCNGAMAGAKVYRMAPVQIAAKVVEQMEGSQVFSSAEAVNPGFINLKASPEFLAAYLLLPSTKKYFLSCAKQTTGIATINKKQLSDLLVMFPDSIAQNDYIAFVRQSDKSKFAVLNCLKRNLLLILQKTEDVHGLINQSTKKYFCKSCHRENHNG